MSVDGLREFGWRISYNKHLDKNIRKSSSVISKKSFFRAVVFDIDVVSKNKEDIEKIRQAIHLIKKIDPRLFSKVLRLKAILIYPGKNEYGAVYEKERIFIDQPKSINISSIQFLASSIIHEAWHIDQYFHGTRKFDGRAERGAYIAQRKFLKKTGTRFELNWLDRQYKSQWWKPESTEEKRDSGYDKIGVGRANIEFWQFLNKYKEGKLFLRDLSPKTPKKS